MNTKKKERKDKHREPVNFERLKFLQLNIRLSVSKSGDCSLTLVEFSSVCNEDKHSTALFRQLSLGLYFDTHASFLSPIPSSFPFVHVLSLFI